MTARYRVSRRGICELARDLFGATLSTGSVDERRPIFTYLSDLITTHNRGDPFPAHI